MVSQKPPRGGPPIVAFAGGGTGGHLYPALAIADALRRCWPDVRCVFFGTHRPIDQRILEGTGHELIRQALPPIRLAPWRWPGMLRGYWQTSRLCRARLEIDRPMVVIGTGSLSSVPAVREAHRAGLCTVLLNPDAIPGRANKHLASQADVVFAQWEETVAWMPRTTDVRVMGCAIRPQFAAVDGAAGVRRFGLDPARRTLLVTGASQGARTVNEAVLANLDFLESHHDWQVLHLTGELDFDRVREAYQGRDIRARVLSFTERMAEAIAAADLVISRAGASTLAEITALGRPGILFPYPFHRDMHQLANARCLERMSAARIVHDAIDPAINGPALRRALEPLMNDDQGRAAMGEAARRMGRASAAGEIAGQIIDLALGRGAPPTCETLEQSC